jgi:hypothetical protein
LVTFESGGSIALTRSSARSLPTRLSAYTKETIDLTALLTEGRLETTLFA